MDQIIVFATLLVLLFLFAWGKFRHDFVALTGLFILVVAGIVNPADAFSGFGHPAVITVASVLIIGKALEHSGLIELLGKWVMKVGNNLTLQIITLSFLVAVASAFMNNVGALAIMMPIAIHMARKSGNPASKILMPIAFASLLGGMTTLIGTPPNIIIATFRADAMGDSFGMFDFTAVGAGLTLAGLIFISLIGWRFLPKRKVAKSGTELFDIDDYITEVEVKESSKILGISAGSLKEVTKADVQLLGIIRNNIRIHIPGPQELFREDDILILETDAEELKTFIEDTGTALVGDKKLYKAAKGSEKIVVTEAIIMANSSLINQTASKLRMRSRYGLNLLAVARREQKIHRRLDRVIFRSGDVLLLQGDEESIYDTVNSIGCLPLAKRDLRIGYKTKIPLALGIFALSIAIVVAGLMPVQVAFGIAALAMVLANVIPAKSVYSAVDWPVIVLLGAMIPVGVAMETTGGAQQIADLIIYFGNSMPGWAMIAILMVVTMFLSDIINNAATVVLMAPVAISVATGMNFSIDPFLMSVAVGGSSAFLTPIGHQSNTLVMGPGGYKFTDYWKMGLPLEIIIVALGTPLIMMVWPL